MARLSASNSWQTGRAGLTHAIQLGVLLLLMGGMAQSARAATCHNADLRTGASARLPACRGYELVSPPDSAGRLLQPINTWNTPPESPELFPTELVDPNGTSIAFMTYMSPLYEARGAIGIGDVYEAQRSPQGWRTDVRLGPSGVQTNLDRPGGVSPDHSYVNTAVETGLSSEGQVSYLFGRDGTAEPVGLGSLGTEPYPQTRFISPGGEHIIFSTGSSPVQSELCLQSEGRCKVLQLESDAPPTGTGAIYDRSADGPTHVVSLLPGNIPLKAGEQAFYKGNSKDASSVAFEVKGTLYVRVDNGDLGDEATLKVAEGSPVYAGLSDGGRYLFYIPGGEKGTIHRFDTVTKADVEANPTAAGELVNVSGDGSHAYFITDEQIGGTGTPGEPNLFVWSGAAPEYITTVVPSDLEETSPLPESAGEIPALTRWTSWVANPNEAASTQGPGADSSRTNLDGSVLVFESRARLTGYDNSEHTEIYRYDEGPKTVTCISCNFGHPAQHDARLQELRFTTVSTIIHNVSDDGSRVFFETQEPLVASDTDGLNDIYEWQASGEESGVHLISSGESVAYPEVSPILPQLSKTVPPPNILMSITPSGSDVVFLSRDLLVGGAPEGGVASIYDARIGGGFPAPVFQKPCAEEDCKAAAAGAPPLTFPATSSESLVGSGNVKSHKHHRHCHRVKGTKKAKCLKKRKRSSRAAKSSLAGASGWEPVENGGDVSPSTPSTPASAQDPVSTSATEIGSEYGLESTDAELSTVEAGAHPDFTTDITLNHYSIKKEPQANDRTEEISVSLPPGLLGNPNAVKQCKTVEFLSENCPLDSQVGVAKVLVVNHGSGNDEIPIYNLVLPHPEQEVARLALLPLGVAPAYIDIKVRTASDYGVTATVYGTSGFTSLVASKTILWADPSDPIHDLERLPTEECKSGKFVCKVPPTGLAFMTNPSACQQMSVGVSARSYQIPGNAFEEAVPLSAISGCTGLPFSPAFEAEPTSHVAGAPTGLKTKLVLPQHLQADERATATMREARVTLPGGMQVAAGAANWIGVCSGAEVGFHEEVDADCPDSSKLGTATIKSPSLPNPIEGTIYQRSPQPGHQLGLWLTSDALGMHIKLPGELEPDKTTGRLTAVFRDLPQVPVEEIDLNVWGGPRAPLQNPDHCGSFITDFTFSPHSDDPAATGQSPMKITEGCNQAFSPSLKAGVTDPIAGKYSPLVVDLSRPDGDQALRGFELKLPRGELAKIKGVPLCSDADAAAASCPAGSRIGSIQATTGPGPEPFTIPAPGKAQPEIYLAGPYQGSPFSIVSEVPAQAGPFDLGVLAVHSGLTVEPETGIGVVKADPLPQFFEGVGIAYRHLRAVVDRPEFNINPTNCRELAVSADVTSTHGSVAHPSARFQVDGCRALKFRPNLTLKLRGGTQRAQYPALSATLKARKGDANIGFTSVALPHSEFLAQEHIGTICTRKQFAADKCPKGSVYGKAKLWTPLLEKPLAGNVYLRSSNHPLPDLVVKLGGQLEIDVVGRIDSVHGGIRTTFESVPDAPFSKFVLQMKGGAKSLLTNSTDICRGSHRATVRMQAQNGRAVNLRPVLASNGCGKKKLGKHKTHH